jgi:asparagine synthase (glutamine-hydrolysing)
MCGIVGIIGNAASEEKLHLMLPAINHRGPDDSGIFITNRLALGHKRLAILDLSPRGHQPMTILDGRYTIIYNGEVYNHLELRAEHLKEVNFKSDSDTETILYLYDKYKERAFELMVGMWALAIWDAYKEKFILSRDRYGQKPLYYAYINHSLYFSSEIKPLLKFIESPAVNRLAISEYLATGNYGHIPEETFFADIKSFPAAHYGTVDMITLVMQTHCYWTIEKIKYRDRLPFDKANIEKMRHLVYQAVDSQLLSDVPVGATVSGGIDSSIIASCVAARGISDFPIFTAQFGGKGAYDETKFIRSLEKKYKGAFAVNYIPIDIRLPDLLGKVIYEQEEPFGDPSIIYHGLLIDEAKKQNVTVILNGQGGDEVSMGYSWMYYRLFAYGLKHGDIADFIMFCKAEKLHPKQVSRLVLSAVFPGTEFRLRLKSRKQHKNWLSEMLQLATPASSFASSSDFYGIYKESLKTVGLPHINHYDDRSCMIRSIEGRMPFLDHRLIDFASKLKVGSFYRNGYSKWIFREAFRNILPDEILNRKDKLGFYTPIIELVKKDIEWFKTHLYSEPCLCNKEVVDNLISGFCANPSVSAAEKIFRLASVKIWLTAFNVRL